MNATTSFSRFACSSLAITACILAGNRFVEAQQKLDFAPRVVIRKPFPAIVEPESVSADKAQRILHANELVLGVELDGVARAYPINMLTGPQREIINDKLGATAIAATW